MSNKPSAVIADDEEQLRKYLQNLLQKIWPELIICGEAANGFEALALISEHCPDIAFLDIQMPGLTGMEVARQMPATCRAVFVTAYDSYAVAAFENEAIDYLLKPVTPERLAKTVYRLKNRLKDNGPARDKIIAVVQTLLTQRPNHEKPECLKWIRVQHGDGVRLIPVDDVLCFKAKDKYTCVITSNGEHLIRTPIKTLARELDQDQFWQIHRSTIVRVEQIAGVSRSLTGRYVIKLKDVSEPLTVSRAYSHLFRQM